MQLHPIAYVNSPYKQKFAIPRQPNLVREAEGELLFEPAYADANALRGLEGFSHLWLIFAFHANAAGWSATVTPPRLGGGTHVGVFASRSPYRPNPLGLSVVEFAGIEQRGDRLSLRVRGLDLLDGTPIYDIKPYLPYADAIVDASAAYAAQAPAACEVRFSEAARHALTQLQDSHPRL
ncbi:MAG TPA: tRNA (N6-threonylcarbamoyladenosine(37)-N6)-methyltransferase TrmO, partial [Hyphomicrobiales bacterium]|nr:tRNA (N6-threonylcarbamoyladenosine(37)-N6)-methyltransferase TrmO [Hyphomicrobiales bacterium]